MTGIFPAYMAERLHCSNVFLMYLATKGAYPTRMGHMEQKAHGPFPSYIKVHIEKGLICLDGSRKPMASILMKKIKMMTSTILSILNLL